MSIDRDFLRTAVGRFIAYAGLIGTLLAVLAEGRSWIRPVFWLLIGSVVVLLVIDVTFYFILRGIPWWVIRHNVRRLIDEFVAVGFSPDVVVGVGRAGSIVGAMVAANMGIDRSLG